MPPRRAPENTLAGAFEAITALANLIQQQQAQNMNENGNGSRIPIATMPEHRNVTRLEKFKRLGPSAFSGTTDPLKAENWIRSLEKVFRAMSLPKNDKPEFAIFLLEGEAEHWRTTVERTVPSYQRPVTWAKFTELFYEHYFSASMKKRKEMEFIQLTQGNMSVIEYEQKFNQLSRFATRFVEDEQWRVEKFEEGLKPAIRGKLAAQRFTSFSEILDRALRVERVPVLQQECRGLLAILL